MKRMLWGLQVVLASVGMLVIWVLSQDDPMSHPPTSVFIPIVLLAWFSFHLLVGVFQFGSWRGETRNVVEGQESRWPVVMFVVVLVYLWQLSGLPRLLFGLFSNFSDWTFIHSIQLAGLLFGVFCLLSILLRQPVARYLAGVGLIGMALLPIIRFVVVVLSDSGFKIHYILSFGPSFALFGLGVYLLISRRVQTFFSGDHQGQMERA